MTTFYYILLFVHIFSVVVQYLLLFLYGFHVKKLCNLPYSNKSESISQSIYLSFIIVIIFINVTLILIIVIITVITFNYYYVIITFVFYLDSFGRGPDGQNIVVINRYCEYIKKRENENTLTENRLILQC